MTPMKDTVPAFSLHPRLADDTLPVADLPLSRLLLMNNRLFPWLILVPRRVGAMEIHRLEPADRVQLMAEMAMTSAVLESLVRPDKINLGALGNIVSQLHVHVIARRIGDPAWPGPVWGSGHAEPYAAGEGAALASRIAAALS